MPIGASVTEAELADLSFPSTPLERACHMADRICKLVEVDRLAAANALQKVLDPELVLQIVLVEQGTAEQVEVPSDRPTGPIRCGSFAIHTAPGLSPACSAIRLVLVNSRTRPPEGGLVAGAA